MFFFVPLSLHYGELCPSVFFLFPMDMDRALHLEQAPLTFCLQHERGETGEGGRAEKLLQAREAGACANISPLK